MSVIPSPDFVVFVDEKAMGKHKHPCAKTREEPARGVELKNGRLKVESAQPLAPHRSKTQRVSLLSNAIADTAPHGLPGGQFGPSVQLEADKDLAKI